MLHCLVADSLISRFPSTTLKMLSSFQLPRRHRHLLLDSDHLMVTVLLSYN